jgi:hypothetical protein
MDANLRTSSSLGSPSIQSVHDYHSFALEDGDRLAPMAVDLVDRLANLVVLGLKPSTGVADSRYLRSESHARMNEYVRWSTYARVRRFLGDVRRELIKCIFVVLHGTLGSEIRDVLHEGSAIVVAYHHAPPRAWIVLSI